jgi:pSer/pThr/pTyr-binding forkhead associated (FHA) protein
MDEMQDSPRMPEGEASGEVEVPEEAFIIIDGFKVIPLAQAVITIGRRVENTLVFEDERVSRFHAQLRAIGGRYVLFDLDSTTGTFVNGQRTTQTILYPGDVISLGGVNLIYGQKNPPPRPDLKDTSPL